MKLPKTLSTNYGNYLVLFNLKRSTAERLLKAVGLGRRIRWLGISLDSRLDGVPKRKNNKMLVIMLLNECNAIESNWNLCKSVYVNMSVFPKHSNIYTVWVCVSWSAPFSDHTQQECTYLWICVFSLRPNWTALNSNDIFAIEKYDMNINMYILVACWYTSHTPNQAR